MERDLRELEMLHGIAGLKLGQADADVAEHGRRLQKVYDKRDELERRNIVGKVDVDIASLSAQANWPIVRRTLMIPIQAEIANLLVERECLIRKAASALMVDRSLADAFNECRAKVQQARKERMLEALVQDQICIG